MLGVLFASVSRTSVCAAADEDEQRAVLPVPVESKDLLRSVRKAAQALTH